jgi:hypothetical protein
MKKVFTVLILMVFALGFQKTSAQEFYSTASGEMIFSWSDARYNQPNAGDDLPYGNSAGDTQDAMRWTVWFHLHINFHYDFNNNFGLFTGIGNRNIGFITMESSSTKDDNGLSDYHDVKWKRRAYALNIPLAIKLGNFDKDFFVFAGAQYEWLYHYKEKEFLDAGKRKYTDWFSDRVNAFIPSVFVGVSLPHGTTIKFTAMLDNMMNQSYTADDGSQPYKYMDSKIMYISVSSFIRWEKDVYTKMEKKESKIAWNY